MASTNDILSIWEKVNETTAIYKGLDPYQGGGTDPSTAARGNYTDAPQFGPGTVSRDSGTRPETVGDSVDARIADSMGGDRMMLYLGIGVLSIVTVIGVAAMMRG